MQRRTEIWFVRLARLVRKNGIFYVSTCDSGWKGRGGVAVRRTAGHGHSIVYRGTTDNLNTFMCRWTWNVGTPTSWNPQGLSRPLMGLLYLTLQRDGATNKWVNVLKRNPWTLQDTHTHTQTGNTPEGENLVTFSSVVIPCNRVYLPGLFIPGS
jgi:hypothetical protein